MSFKKLKIFLLLSTLLAILCVACPSYADALDVQLSSDKVALGENVTVSFTLDSNAKTPSPDFSALEKDFHILSTNYGHAINITNGVTAVKTFWQLTLEPKKTGVAIIPEINFGSLKSPARQLTVAENSDHVTTDSQASPTFVQAELSTTNPYIQSQVLYTFKLFFQAPFVNSMVEMPTIKDATLVEVGDGNHYETTINGKSFSVAEKIFAIFPQKSGTISIPPFHFQGLSSGANQNIINSPFYVSEPQTISLATQAFNLTVKKIPDAFQGKTWLPAKNISLTEQWSPDSTQWEAGNPVTRTITVKALGLRADQIPDVSIDKMPGVNIYVDTPKRSISVEDNGLVGLLEQKVTYIPSTSGSFTIPAIKLNWWNLQTNTNAVAQLNPLTIQVKGIINNTAPTPTSNIPSAAAKPVPVNPPATNIKTAPFYVSIWFWLAAFFLVIWLVTLWLIWHKKTVKNNKTSPNLQPLQPELNDKNFAQACEEGNTAVAQQFLLSWAKKQWQDIPLNLEKLQEVIHDENFKNELKNLEQAIYAKKVTPWNGRALLANYQKIKKHRKTKDAKNFKPDPLPPLNP